MTRRRVLQIKDLRPIRYAQIERKDIFVVIQPDILDQFGEAVEKWFECNDNTRIAHMLSGKQREDPAIGAYVDKTISFPERFYLVGYDFAIPARHSIPVRLVRDVNSHFDAISGTDRNDRDAERPSRSYSL